MDPRYPAGLRMFLRPRFRARQTRYGQPSRHRSSNDSSLPDTRDEPRGRFGTNRYREFRQTCPSQTPVPTPVRTGSGCKGGRAVCLFHRKSGRGLSELPLAPLGSGDLTPAVRERKRPCAAIIHSISRTWCSRFVLVVVETGQDGRCRVGTHAGGGDSYGSYAVAAATPQQASEESGQARRRDRWAARCVSRRRQRDARMAGGARVSWRRCGD